METTQAANIFLNDIINLGDLKFNGLPVQGMMKTFEIDAVEYFLAKN